MVKTLVFILLAPLAGFAQHAAGSGSDDRSTAPEALRPGTMFVNTYYVTDSSDAPVPLSVADPEMGDDTQVVVRVGAHLYGRSDCVAITGPNHGDTNIFSFTKNGDMYLLNTNHRKWDYLPFGLKPGKVIKTEPQLDTGTAIGHHYEMMTHRELSVLGHEKMELDGVTYDCIKLLLNEVKVFEGKEYEVGTIYRYSPKVGYFLRVTFGWGAHYFLNQKIAFYKPKAS